jgi:lipopolysaccharide export system permease protein
MSLLDRFIARSLAKGWLTVTVVLAAIFGLITFVGEMERITPSYGAGDAMRYVTLTMPQLLLDLSPVIALLGTLFALATMAKNNELTIMWSAGVSVRRFLGSVAIPSVILMLLITLASEYAAAPLYQRAEAERTLLRSGTANLIKGNGLWSKNGMRFTNVRSFRLGHIPEGIDIYEFNDNDQLISSTRARYAEIQDDRTWMLFDVTYKELIDGQLKTRHIDQLAERPLWSKGELPGLSLASAGMSLTDLYAYAKHLQSTGQPYYRYELDFWKLALLPLTLGAMILLATPIGTGLGTQRAHSFEIRIALGAIIGIVFYLGSPIIHTAGAMLKLSTPVIAAIPLFILLLISGYLFKRMR